MGRLTLTLRNRPYNISTPMYLDACFLIAVYHQMHDQYVEANLLWAALLRETARSNAIVYYSGLVVDECLWGLTAAHYETVNGRRSWAKLSKPARDAASTKHRPEQEGFINDLKSQKCLSFVDAKQQHIDPAFREMKHRNLWPRDAFHVALARSCGARCLVTNDQKLSRALASDPTIDPFDYATIDMTPPT